MFGSNQNYTLQIVVEGKDQASGPLSGISGALSNIGQIAGGIITANVLQNIAQKVIDIGSSAINATGQMQAFEVGLSSLVARELKASSATTDYTTTTRAATQAEMDRKNWLEQAIDAQQKKIDSLQSGSDAELSAIKRMQALRGELQGLGIDEAGMIASTTSTTTQTLSLADALSQAGPKAQELSDKLRKIAILSPYELGTVQDTFKLGMAFGFTSDEAMSFTNGILNMAAGVGANNEMMGRMAYNFAQIRMQGKVTAVDVRQLAMAGFDLNGALSGIGAQMGVTIKDYEDFNAAIASGKIKWSDFAGAFEKYANDNFGGASERMSRTLEGLKSTFKDFFLLTMPTLFGPAVEAVTGFLNKILTKFIEFSDSGRLEEWGKSIGESVTKVVDWFNTLEPVMTKVQRFFDLLNAGYSFDLSLQMAGGFKFPPELQNMIDLVKGGIENFKLFWDQNGPAIMENVNQVKDALVSFFADMGSKVGTWGSEQFEKISAWFVANGPLIQEWLSGVSERFMWLMDAVSSAWTWIEPILSGLVDNILNVVKAFMQLSTGDFKGALDTFNAMIMENIQIAIDFIGNFLNWIAGLFGTSLAEIGAIWSGVWQAFLTTVSLVTQLIVSKFLEFKANIISRVLEIKTNIENGFENARTAVITTLANLVTGVITKFIEIKTKITNMIGDFKSAGENIIQGLKDGMAAKVQEVLSWIANVAAEIAGKFKNAMKINSPSKVFFGFGEGIYGRPGQWYCRLVPCSECH